MSGGAYDGKLAKPLAREGLYVRLHDLFEPDWRELALAGVGLTSAENSYRKWPMGNEAFVTTRKVGDVVQLAKQYGMKVKQVGKIERAKDGRTGVDLTACNGEDVYYSGTAA